MANIGPGKNYAKKDLNFFAQFTAKARQQARVLFFVVLASLAVVGVFVLWTGIELFKNLAVTLFVLHTIHTQKKYMIGVTN